MSLLLKTIGLKIIIIKIDLYININTRIMVLIEYKKRLILNNSGKVDLDLDNYKQYIGIILIQDNNITQVRSTNI